MFAVSTAKSADLFQKACVPVVVVIWSFYNRTLCSCTAHVVRLQSVVSYAVFSILPLGTCSRVCIFQLSLRRRCGCISTPSHPRCDKVMPTSSHTELSMQEMICCSEAPEDEILWAHDMCACTISFIGIDDNSAISLSARSGVPATTFLL